jgi:hypothetical protein
MAVCGAIHSETATPVIIALDALLPAQTLGASPLG